MLMVREILHCKPGKVKPMVKMFLEMNKLGAKSGWPQMRVMTDFAGERYWTVVAEMEVATLSDFENMMAGTGMSEEDGKAMEKIMKDYHELVDYGSREIYKIEG